VLLGSGFINVKRTNFLYERCFGSFYYVHVTRKKLPKQCSYEKFAPLTLMKLTAVRIKAECKMLVNLSTGTSASRGKPSRAETYAIHQWCFRRTSTAHPDPAIRKEAQQGRHSQAYNRVWQVLTLSQWRSQNCVLGGAIQHICLKNFITTILFK